MKMMRTENCVANIDVVQNEQGVVTAQYTRGRDLKFSVKVCVKPKEDGLAHYISEKCEIEFQDRHSVVPILACLEQLAHRMSLIKNTEVPKGLVDFALNALRSRKPKDYINGQVPRRLVNGRIYEALKPMLRPFENNPRFRRKYTNPAYQIFRSEIIDLEGQGEPDNEQIALLFVKTPQGFNIALDYRFMKPIGKGVDTGRVLLSKQQPETIPALYGLVVKGLKELVKTNRISEGTMEVLSIDTEQMFIKDERDIAEVLYRLHTFNI